MGVVSLNVGIAIIIRRRIIMIIIVAILIIIVVIIEGSLEAKLPTIWKDGNGTARKKLGRGES